MNDVLGAPCVFCDYNGQGYWQKQTHAEYCPWREVAGLRDRLSRVVPLIKNMHAELIAGDAYIDELEQQLADALNELDQLKEE